jgi:Mn2+/Fe2+ NRAMP family transporter
MGVFGVSCLLLLSLVSPPLSLPPLDHIVIDLVVVVVIIFVVVLVVALAHIPPLVPP